MSSIFCVYDRLSTSAITAILPDDRGAPEFAQHKKKKSSKPTGRGLRCQNPTHRCARLIVPTPICQLPAFNDAICCGISRIAAMIRPQVSSAFEDVRGDEKREVNPLTAP